MSRAFVASLLITLGAGCGNKPPAPTDPVVEQPVSEDGFVRAVAVTPADALLTWFEGEGAGKLVRLPVVVTPSPLGLASGYAASSTAIPEADGLLLKLDDGALGVSLADRIADDCPFGEPCAIWIEGVWGATVDDPLDPMAGFDIGPKKHPFSVRDYAGLVEGSAEFVQVKAG